MYASWGEVEVGHVHGHGLRGSKIGECKGIKILRQEKHTNRGSRLMNFDWVAFVMCIFMCLLCIAYVLN
jgi:hypothetical protein